jgi:pilus assembly protein CpaB
MARIQGLTMGRSNRGLLVVAALAGLAAAVLFVVAVNQDDSSSGGASTPGSTVPAVVAAQSIAAGTEIKENMIKVIDVPEDLLAAEAYSDTAPVVGEVTRHAIAEGDQITTSKIGPAVETGTGSFPYAIPAGKRGVSLEVREVTAVGGLLVAGNRVDVIGAFKIKGAPGLADNEYILSVQTILQNVEVLSVAQEHTEPLPVGATGDTADSGSSGQPPEDVKEQPGAASVTLALSPEEAQQLISAQVSAVSVWTSLRPAGESAPVDVPSYDRIIRE